MMIQLLAQAEPVLRSLPAAAHILVALGLGTGLVLWLCGRVVLRPLFGFLGALLGAAIAFFVLPAAGAEQILGFPSPYVGMAVGAAIGLIAGILLYRFAVAISMAAVVGMASLLGVGIYLDSQPVKDAALTTRESIRTPALDEAGRLSLNTEEVREAAITVAGQVREFLDARSAEIRAAWQQVPATQRITLVLAGVGGTVAGFFIGFLVPRRSAAASTALIGSAIWLPCLGWILSALGTTGADITRRSSLVWLAIWLVVAVVGFAVQVSGLGRHSGGEAPD